MPTTNPVPSQDPSDLLFNAGKLDEVLNGTGNSFTDRLGTARRTVAGMNADFDAQLADAESDLNVYRSDAAASAAEALGYLQTIRATSYGAYSSDPATDPLGNPPTVGDEYFNTTANLLKRWNGTTWQASDINTANLAASSGSSLVGFDGGTVQDVMDNAKAIANYTALRNYTGRATCVRITQQGLAGVFQRDDADTTSADNGGTIIVDAAGRRWKRQFEGDVHARWFGAKGNWNGSTGQDDTAAIQAFFDATPYGTLDFGGNDYNYKISAPISIATDANAGLSRRDRHIKAYGAVITCTGVGQADAFLFSAAGPWPASSFSLSAEGLTFGGTVSRAFISFPDADNFFEQMQFERITTTNAAVGELFFFQNGTESNLGGVTLRKCSGGPNTTRFLHLKGSEAYGQFDDWTIEDCFHLGTGSMFYLDGSVATTTLQYSRIRRNFSAGFGLKGISGANQYITFSTIENFYAEPKGNAYDSIDCELIGCTVENVVNTVHDFTGKTIRVLVAGSVRDTDIINCLSYNGVTAPWETGTYVDVQITNPENVSIKGRMEKFFNRAVSYGRPYIYPGNAESVRLCSAQNDLSITTTGAKTLYTFTNASGGVAYDLSDDIFEIDVAGQLFGGATNFAMSFQLFDGTNTETLATISTSALENNARHFKMSATIMVSGAVFQTLHSEAFFANAIFTKPPRTYAERGLVVRANNPILRVNVTTLNAGAVEVNYVKIVRNRRVSTYTLA